MAEVDTVVEAEVVAPLAQADVDIHRRIAAAGPAGPESDRVADIGRVERRLAAARPFSETLTRDSRMSPKLRLVKSLPLCPRTLRATLEWLVIAVRPGLKVK